MLYFSQTDRLREAAPAPERKERAMINTRHRIEFDPDKCAGCQLCYKSCFVDVIRWDAANRKPVFQYVVDCYHCFY